MWRLLLLLIALPAMAQDAQPLLGPGTLPPRGPAAAAEPPAMPPFAAAPSAVEAAPLPAPSPGASKAPEPVPAQAPMPGSPAMPAPPAMTLAPDPMRCGPAREGQVACMSGRLCACRFERGGTLTGRGEHFAWDCGPLRPSCNLPPADLPGMAQPDIQVFPQIVPMRRH